MIIMIGKERIRSRLNLGITWRPTTLNEQLADRHEVGICYAGEEREREWRRRDIIYEINRHPARLPAISRLGQGTKRSNTFPSILHWNERQLSYPKYYP